MGKRRRRNASAADGDSSAGDEANKSNIAQANGSREQPGANTDLNSHTSEPEQDSWLPVVQLGHKVELPPGGPSPASSASERQATITPESDAGTGTKKPTAQGGRSFRPLEESETPKKSERTFEPEGSSSQVLLGKTMPTTLGVPPVNDWRRKPAKRPEKFAEIPIPSAWSADRVDCSEDGKTAVVQVRAASSRGPLHEFYGEPRQDSYAIRITDNENWVIAAVADGLGTSPFSEEGSRIATEVITHAIVKKINAHDDGHSGDVGKLDFERLIKESFVEASEKVKEECGRLSLDPMLALLTTLTVAVVRASKLTSVGATEVAWLAWIGDSPIIVLNLINSDLKIYGRSPLKTGNGPIVNEPTKTLTTHVQDVVIKEYWPGANDAILLTTDGFGNALVGDHTAELSKELSDFLTSKKRVHPLEFLRILDFIDANHSDDRTAVAIWRH